MAERLILDAEPRNLFGKRAKKLRRQGVVPAVIYGQRDPVHIQVDRLPLRRALRQAGSNELIDINLTNTVYTVLAREIQQHPTRFDLIHVDFYEVDMAETVTAEVELVMVGETADELATMGQVAQILYSIEVECLPSDLVSEIEFDISHVSSADDTITAGDLTLPSGLTLVADPEMAITSFEYFREEEEEEEEEDLLFAAAADEVEVISKGKVDEEDEGKEDED